MQMLLLLRSSNLPRTVYTTIFGVTTFSQITTPVPKKSEVEQTDDLMKQMMEECKIDESLASASSSSSTTTVTEQEIEQRLAKLKDMDPSKNWSFCGIHYKSTETHLNVPKNLDVIDKGAGYF